MALSGSNLNGFEIVKLRNNKQVLFVDCSALKQKKPANDLTGFSVRCRLLITGKTLILQ